MAERISVLVVGKHSLCLEAVGILIEAAPDLELLAIVDFENRDRIPPAAAPDVVVLHALSCQGEGRLTDVVSCVYTFADSAVLVLSCDQDEEEIVAAVEAGALGYLATDSRLASITDAIRSVAKGEVVLSPALSARILAHMRRRSKRPVEVPSRRDAEQLTERELEVLGSIAGGATNRQVAGALGLSESTVKNHLQAIFRKMGVASRSQAIAEAVKRGMVKL